MQGFETFIKDLSDIVWGPPLLILLLGTHIFLTFRLKFIQRFIGKAIKISLHRTSEGTGDVSQFGALTTALAATIGTGNIVGVATAVAAGGPGAVLWMWLTGVFGIATKYSEALLAVHYRVQMPNGQMAGGPMYALERGLNGDPKLGEWRLGPLARWLGIVFAALTAIAAFGIGNMVQANSISSLVDETFRYAPDDAYGWLSATWHGVPAIKWLTGLAVTGLTALVILGGIKWIA